MACAQAVNFLLGQILDLLRCIDVGLGAEPAGALLPDPVDGRQPDPQPLVAAANPLLRYVP